MDVEKENGHNYCMVIMVDKKLLVPATYRKAMVLTESGNDVVGRVDNFHNVNFCFCGAPGDNECCVLIHATYVFCVDNNTNAIIRL